MQVKIIIGVGGGTGSGKTTFSQNLMKALGPERVLLLSQDDYYNDRSDLPLEKRLQLNFDEPAAIDFRLLVHQLRRLQQGRSVAKPKYDFREHIRRKEVNLVSPRQIILVEGTLVFARIELAKCFDLKIFLEVDSDIRFIRRLRRDMMKRGRTVESVVQQYLLTVRPMYLRFIKPSKHQADMVISGDEGCDEQLDEVLQRINSVGVLGEAEKTGYTKTLD